VVAESVLVKQQLLILNRSRQRSPNPCFSDRLVVGLCAFFIRPARRIRSAIVLKASTFLSIHQALRNRKYRLLFSCKRKGKPGPKGPSKELIDAVVQMKQRNPSWGCPRIAQQMALAFDIVIDKDIVRRILASHYRPGNDAGGPSWLTFIGHMKDSLWSLDLFRRESATLRTYWVLVVMDQYTPPDHWVRRPCRNRQRCRTLPDLQPRHSMATADAQVPAPTMIPFSGLTSGKPICGYWR
jgi:putative transposase